MARGRSELTRLEIIQYATRTFLEKGYSVTRVREIANELNISPGNLTFHYPTKEHMLAELVTLLCDFQWKMMEVEAQDGVSSLMAVCLELAAMASICEEDQPAKDFYLSAYCSPMCLGIIRTNDTVRAKRVFGVYCADWSEEHFLEAEILVSGIEYATLMTAGTPVPLETRLAGALNAILGTYNVPPEIRKMKIDKLLTLDYRGIGRRILNEFKKYVNEANDQALDDLQR